MIRLCAFSDEAANGIAEQAAALRRNNIGLTEMRSVDGKNVSVFTAEEAKEYRKVLDGNGVAVWSIGSPLGKVDISCDFPAYLDTVKHVAEIANVFGTDKIRAFSFYNAYGERNKVIDYMERMAEATAPYGVTLYHENEKEIYGDTLPHVKFLQDSVRGWKWIYDPANYLQCGEKAQDTLDALHAKTDYFHIKDVIVATGELVPAGYGDGAIPDLVNRITDDKVLTIEPHLAIFDAFKTIDNSEMKHKFRFASNGEAFDAACRALRDVILAAGYREVDGGFVR